MARKADPVSAPSVAAPAFNIAWVRGIADALPMPIAFLDTES